MNRSHDSSIARRVLSEQWQFNIERAGIKRRAIFQNSPYLIRQQVLELVSQGGFFFNSNNGFSKAKGILETIRMQMIGR